jgi:hypothetical protein
LVVLIASSAIKLHQQCYHRFRYLTVHFEFGLKGSTELCSNDLLIHCSIQATGVGPIIYVSGKIKPPLGYAKKNCAEVRISGLTRRGKALGRKLSSHGALAIAGHLAASRSE